MSDFALVLNDMRDHYKKNLGKKSVTRFRPVEEVHDDILFAAVTDDVAVSGEEVLAQLKITAKAGATATATAIQNGITDATGVLKDHGATSSAVDDFISKMNKQREDAKQNASKTIDKIYDEAISIGKEHPKLQGLIAGLMDTVSQLFHELVSKIVDFVAGIVKSVVAWLNTAWKSINTFFSSVGSWVSGWF
ncbi:MULTISPECIES: hypothetical protein [Enterobacteriaceae]|uniref:hypothetical protein n=2 Tax=Enterobacterales TaxID=91347 RepID=UPI0015DCF8D9|nr:hypothetical protein [Klebsiella sp. WP8-S18-ESBL-06]BBT70874.1 hypothetical protein WP8S18E06_21730 [Klebsiella sp. WP8-S18-ESBL-06]